MKQAENEQKDDRFKPNHNKNDIKYKLTMYSN